jgi:peptidoglycan/LPS O-acetylase OafA/YrhL
MATTQSPRVLRGARTGQDSLDALTGIRFLAAFQVVIFHFGAGFARRHHSPPVLSRFLGSGYTAVTLFFLLSGFILTYTYSHKFGAAVQRYRFWQARFARIYPVYLLSLLLMLPFVIGTLHLWGTLGAIFMVQAWNPVHPETAEVWNGPAWTLSTEAFFYLLFPFVLPFLERLSSVALRVLGAALLLLILFAHTMARMDVIWAPRLLIPLCLFHFPEFLLGVIVGIQYQRHRLPAPWAARLTLAALLSVVLIDCTVGGIWMSLLIIPFTALIFALAHQEGAIAGLLSRPWFVLLGGASYAVYILQVPIRRATGLVIGEHGLRGLVSECLSPILLIGISILVFRFIEEPMRRHIRTLFQPRAKVRPQPQSLVANPAEVSTE